MTRRRWRPHWTELLGSMLAIGLVTAGALKGEWLAALVVALSAALALGAWHVIFVDPPRPEPVRHPVWWGSFPSLWSLLKGDGPAAASRGDGAALLVFGSALVAIMLSSSSLEAMSIIGRIALGVATLEIFVGIRLLVRPKRAGSRTVHDHSGR